MLKPQNRSKYLYDKLGCWNAKYEKKIIDIIDRTEINSVVIDIKDYTGKISFEIEDLVERSWFV